jgi:hypothetical protein
MAEVDQQMTVERTGLMVVINCCHPVATMADGFIGKPD